MKTNQRSRRVRFYAINSIRMCITCKSRLPQYKLMRFQAKESKLLLYNGSGRSFYICSDCLTKPKTTQHIKRYIKQTNNIEEQLKEIIQIWQVSEK